MSVNKTNIKGKNILITGGLGFIGFNASRHFASENRVCVIDDCSRAGVEHNIDKLKELGVEYHHVDISRFKELRDIYLVFQPDVVLHMAAQVAVTLSISNPIRDFRANVQGTFNLLELARTSHKRPVILYASTNKVYGENSDDVILKNGRYALRNPKGCSERDQLSFDTPYGCSKGAADQYCIDYARTYGVPTVIFRQSCIYGPYQYGMEDQGWLAWFAICSALGKPIKIFGDGNQVRDALYIDDLIDLYEKAIINIDSVKGQVFNIGGGPENTISLNELVKILNEKTGEPLKVSFANWRLGDQKIFVADVGKVEKLLKWKPATSPEAGVEKLLDWIKREKNHVETVLETQKNRKQYDVSIIIPAKNEETCLAAVLDEINFMIQSSPYRYEVIVVNDRSTDRTVEIAKEYSFVKVIDNKNNPGKGGALRSGFDIAQGTYITMMDADFSHNATDLPFMVDEVRTHKGLVIGSRITGGSEEYTRIRAFGNVILTWLFGFCHGRYLSDALNGFKVFHHDVYSTFEYTADGYEIEIELLANTLRLKRQITEIPSRERARSSGKAKSSVVKDGTLFCMRTIVERFRKPKRK